MLKKLFKGSMFLKVNQPGLRFLAVLFFLFSMHQHAHEDVLCVHDDYFHFKNIGDHALLSEHENVSENIQTQVLFSKNEYSSSGCSDFDTHCFDEAFLSPNLFAKHFSHLNSDRLQGNTACIPTYNKRGKAICKIDFKLSPEYQLASHHLKMKSVILLN